MRKHIIFMVLLSIAGSICAADPRLAEGDIGQRIKQVRDVLTTQSTETTAEDDNLTVRALVSIIEEESKLGGDKSLKHRALRELGRYPDSELAIQTLIREIEFEPAQIGGVKDNLKGYTAAKALTKMGSLAREKLIRGLRKPLAEPELHLRAQVLARMDWDVYGGAADTEIILHRLRSEFKARKEDPEPPGEKEAKAAVLFNLQRLIDILEKPGALMHRIPVAGE